MTGVDDQTLTLLHVAMPILSILLIGCAVGAGALTAMLASDKGHNPAGWFIVGAFFGPLALLTLIGLSSRPSTSSRTRAQHPSNRPSKTRSPGARLEEFYWGFPGQIIRSKESDTLRS